MIVPQRVGVSGGELSYLDIGEGPAVVLLHGFPLSSLHWRELIPALAARSRVIAPDLLGTGASEKPVGPSMGPVAQAGRVAQLLTGLGIDRCAVVAHGTGAAAALALAAQGNGVEAMVLMDVVDAWPLREEPSPGPRAAIERILDLGMRRRERFGAPLVDGYAAAFVDDPDAFVRLQRAVCVDPASERTVVLDDITCPVLVMWGEDDPFAPVAAAEQLNEAMPSSTLALLPGCGHFLLDEAPETIGPMIAEYIRAMYLRVPHGHDGQKEGVVMLQLERRPPWVDLAEEERDDWFDVDAGPDAGAEEPAR